MISVQGVYQPDSNVIAGVLQSWCAPREEHVVIVFKQSANTETTYQLLHWCMRLIDIVDASQQQKRIVVNFDNFARDAAAETKRIVDSFGLQLDIAASLPVITCSRQPVTSLELQQKLGHAAILYKNLSDCLNKLAQDQWSFESDDFRASWQTILTDYHAIHPFYLYLDKLHREQKVWLRKIRNIQKSIFWKISWPLRLIEDTIRNVRRARRVVRR